MFRLWESELCWPKIVMLTEADKKLAICVGAATVGVFSNDPWVGDMAILTNSGIKVTSHDYDVMVGDALNGILQLVVEVCFFICGCSLSGRIGNYYSQRWVAFKIRSDDPIRNLLNCAQVLAHLLGMPIPPCLSTVAEEYARSHNGCPVFVNGFVCFPEVFLDANNNYMLLAAPSGQLMQLALLMEGTHIVGGNYQWLGHFEFLH